MRILVTYLSGLVLLMMLSACLTIIPGEEPELEPQPAALLQGEKAHVLFVIDGDTIEIEFEGQSYRVRYIGVDTPERDEPYYEEASKANSVLVEDQEIILVRDVSETDKFGRLLRYIYLPDGTFVNAELISQGFGRVITFPPDVANADYFADLQRRAREDQRGLWRLPEMQGLPAGCDTCGKNNHDCRDFNSQAAAQACFDFCMAATGEDIHNLDGGDEGFVCTSLP